LGRAPVQLTVVDRRNHHLFQPLLYQVATASLSPANIAYPIRSTLRRYRNTEVLMAEVVAIDRAARKVSLVDSAEGFERRWSVEYDYLVVATGATHSYFGNGEWAAFAPGLKSISDATTIRQRILTAFEAAEMEEDPERRAEWMHFALVGGGPTGVEMAGAIAELAHRALARDFRRINPRTARITLLEAGPRLLAAFPESLSEKARRDLERLGVVVRTNTRVSGISEHGVRIGEEVLRAKNVIWTAGVVASPAGQWLGTELDAAGRVLVDEHLNLPGDDRVFVLGDTACCIDRKTGKPLPGVAPVAMQQGRYAGDVIRARVRGRKGPGPFRYWDKGNLATIGRGRAVAAVGALRLTGWLAWLVWTFVHVAYLIGFRNRVVVLFEWAWSYVTFQRGARLIP
jgi:NADH dehydrogenase